MDELIRILAFCQNTRIAGVLLRFLRSIKNGFCRLVYSTIVCCYRCYHRSRADYYYRAWRKHWLSSLQALHEVKPRLVAGLLLLVLLPSFLISPAHAATYNTAQINGKYYPLTGVLNNPAVGAAVELGTLAITKANPWVAGIGTGLVVYKMLEELFPGTFVAFRPGLVSEANPSWPSNVPPSSNPGTVSPDGYDYKVDPPDPYLQSASAAAQAFISKRCPTFGAGYSCSLVSVSSSVPATNFSWTAIAPNGTVFPYTHSFFSRVTVKVCPSGYTLVSGNCNLTNPALVKYEPDGVSTYVVGADGKFQPDPRDPDTPAASVSGISGSSSVTQKTTDGKQSSTTQANPDGSITHTTSNQYFDDLEGVIKDFKQSVTINNAGNVTSYSTTNNAVNVTNGQTTPVNSDFPNDYNRESTQLELKNAVKDDIQAANDAKAALGSGPDGPTYDPLELNLPAQSSFTVAETDSISGLFPVNDGSCVTLSVNLPFFSGLILDPCVVVTAARPFIDWGVMALGLLAGFFVWFGKTEET